MTVPGNAVVVLVLVALFLACTGYAAGRLHQWRRRRLDRDAAYREGYETAARRTFSTAARLIGPRRDRSAARASASVLPSTPGEQLVPINPADPSTSAASPAAQSGRASTRAGSTAVAAMPVQPTSPAATRPSAAPPADAVADHPARGPFPEPESPRLPESVARPISRRAAARSRRFHSMFPTPSITPSAGTAPTDHSDRQLAEAGLPQVPATHIEPTPTPARQHTAAADPQHAASDDAARSTITPDASTPAKTAAPEKASRPGRHLVPDELVRAATYRLSPDRVARAKVPGAQPPPGAEGSDRNPPTAVPKPRRQPADDHAGGPAAP